MKIPSVRALLRMHVEAVWGVALPPVEPREVLLLAESIQPAWRLYVADLAEERICIWRRDVEPAQKAVLRASLEEIFALSGDVASPAGVSREVALCLADLPDGALATAQSITRPLTGEDRALIEAAWPGKAESLLQAACYPLLGVVIAGRLLSLAHSSRRTKQACELGIDTLPEARRRGYALVATRAWSAAVVQEGLTPIYSALAENTASLRLAAAAGYRIFARGITVQ